MKQKTQNKAIDPNLDRSNQIEGRSAGPGEAEYNFPLDGLTVVAKTPEEAERKRDEIVKNRSIENKENITNSDNEENK